jgi:hypothetical protein
VALAQAHSRVDAQVRPTAGTKSIRCLLSWHLVHEFPGISAPSAGFGVNKELMAAEMFRQVEEAFPSMSEEHVDFAMRQISAMLEGKEMGNVLQDSGRIVECES